MRVKGLDISITGKEEINIYGNWIGSPSELQALIRVLADTATSVIETKRRKIKNKLEKKLMGAAAQPNISSKKNKGNANHSQQARSAADPRQTKEGKDV